jgi:hypothetical protein
MKQLAVVTVLIFGGILAWLFGSRLSADALGMAVGLLFGVLAGIPTALLVLASNRRRRPDDDEGEEEEMQGPYGYGGGYGGGRGRQQMLGQPYGYQPPVVVVTAPQAAPAGGQWQNAQPYPQGPYGQGGYPQTVDSVGYPVRQALPGPGAPGTPGGRVFRVVGEKEEVLDEW